MNNERPQSRRNPVRGIGTGAAMVISSLVLGICTIIAGASVSGSVKKLTAAVEKQEFSSSYTSPSALTVSQPAEKKYVNSAEAADYLCMTSQQIKAAVEDGRIDEYIKNGDDDIISLSELDDFFSEEAFRRYNADNS